MEKEILEVNRLHLNNIVKDMGEEKLLELKERFMLEYTFDAVGMEGKNKIPLNEVARLYKAGMINGYSEREQKEVVNHLEAYKLMKKWLKDGITDIDEEKLKDLHEVLVRDIFQGGIYRNVNIQIVGAKHQPTSHFKVYDKMKKAFNNEEYEQMSDFEKALYSSAQIAKIHPFFDANGRVGRLVMNFYLMKAGYIPISISEELRDEYFNHLETFKIDDNIEPLTKFIKNLINKRYESLINELE